MAQVQCHHHDPYADVMREDGNVVTGAVMKVMHYKDGEEVRGGRTQVAVRS